MLHSILYSETKFRASKMLQNNLNTKLFPDDNYVYMGLIGHFCNRGLKPCRMLIQVAATPANINSITSWTMLTRTH